MSVRIGIAPGLGAPLSPEDYWRWVDLCEEAGIDSIWHSDQLLGQTIEPLAALGAIAGRTRRMRFGTNALVVSQRDPLIVAKQLAAIDYLSGGRVFPVVGVGNAGDRYWAASGIDPKDRGRRADEAIGLIRMLLEQDAVEFNGVHFRYAGPGVEPRPARPIPLWIGGHSAAAIRRTAQIGDGWLGGLMSADLAGETRRRIEAALTETGRRIESDHYGISLPFRIGAADDPAVGKAMDQLMTRLSDVDRGDLTQSSAIGPAAHVIAVLRRLVAAGMSKFVVVPLADGAEDFIEQTRLLASEVVPAIEG